MHLQDGTGGEGTNDIIFTFTTVAESIHKSTTLAFSGCLQTINYVLMYALSLDCVRIALEQVNKYVVISL